MVQDQRVDVVGVAVVLLMMRGIQDAVLESVHRAKDQVGEYAAERRCGNKARGLPCREILA